MMIGTTMEIDEDPAPVGMHGTVRCRIEKLQFRAVREAEMPPCRGRRSSSRFTEYPRYLRITGEPVVVTYAGPNGRINVDFDKDERVVGIEFLQAEAWK